MLRGGDIPAFSVSDVQKWDGCFLGVMYRSGMVVYWE